MKYVFILGRNIELSKKEVECYLERTGNEIINSELNKNGFFVEVDKEISEKSIDFLGGSLAIGKVEESFDISEVEGKLKNIMIYRGEKNNINYAVWDFSQNYSEFLDTLKEAFKNEKLKASLKGLSKKMEMQDSSEEIFIPSSKLIDVEYFLFSINGREYFGRIIQKSNYDEIERRDMERPVRRPSLDISPRLAKIMINISLVKEGEKLLDPFCGVGVVLSEGLLQKLKVFGVDFDKSAISGAKENLRWFNFSEENYRLFYGDSRELNLPEFDVMITEPDLGERLKKIPTKEKAEKQLKDFERLMVQVINNTKKMNSLGKIVFSSPYIRIGKNKRLRCRIEEICSRTGYNVVGEGIPEFREGQVIGRMIWVLDKNK